MELDPGEYNFDVELPNDTYVHVEIGVPEAKPGATLSWLVHLVGKPLLQESEKLEQPLKRGYAFVVQLEFDDLEQTRTYLNP